MPLNTTAERGRYDFKTDNVYFFMVDGSGQRVRCGVTLGALEVFDPKTSRQGGACVVCFDAHRKRIEQTASAKYDMREGAPDGTVMVTRTDLSIVGP